EALGLLNPVPRVGAYRVYTDKDVFAIGLIKQAQALGFKLAELVSFRDPDQEPDWPRIAAYIATKRQEVAGEIDRLHTLDRELERMHDEINRCLVAQAHGEPEPPIPSPVCAHLRPDTGAGP